MHGNWGIYMVFTKILSGHGISFEIQAIEITNESNKSFYVGRMDRFFS